MEYKFIDCPGSVWHGEGYRYDPIFEILPGDLGDWVRTLKPKAIQRVS